MLIRSIRIIRATLLLVWATATLCLLGLVAVGHVLPSLGRELYVVRGGSMAPSIPLGSVVVVRHVETSEVSLGDIITFRGSNGTVVTHRVVAIPEHADDPFKTKGDASAAADPFVVPTDSVIGTVEVFAPMAGGILLMLGSAAGVAATIALLGSLLCAIWFMDQLITSMGRSSAGRATAAEPVS